jgi:hypothetical protein
MNDRATSSKIEITSNFQKAAFVIKPIHAYIGSDHGKI